MQIIPAVDVLDGAVVRLVRGDFDRATRYDGTPEEAVRRWAEEGATLVHVVDLAGARDGRCDLDLWTRLGRSGFRFQAGGGIRGPEEISRVLRAGADRLVIGTAALDDVAALTAMTATFGKERIVVAVDVADGRARGRGWIDEGRELAGVLKDVLAAGACRVLVTGVARDGTMQGPDLELLQTVASGVPDVSIIASGGVGSLADITALAEMGVEAIVIGRAFYEARFSFAEAVAAAGT